MPSFFKAGRPVIELSDLGDRFWAPRDGEQSLLHDQFLASQLEPRSYEIHGLHFACPAGIYHPDEDSTSRFILKELVRSVGQLGDKVLDVGTGCGAIGVTLASLGKRVTVTDIDPVAVACAQGNAVANGVEVTALQSDMLDGVEDRGFDLIVFNAPLLDKPIEHPTELIACDTGGVLLRRLLDEAPGYLAPGGILAFLASNLGNRAAIEGSPAYHYQVAASDYSASTGVHRWLVFARLR